MNFVVYNYRVGSGFFTVLNELLELIYYNLNNNKKIHFDISSEFYPYKDNKEDIYHEEIFEIRDLDINEKLNIKNLIQHNMEKKNIKLFKNLNFYNLNTLFFKTIKLNEIIYLKFNKLFEEYKDYFLIGAHFRNSNHKRTENINHIKNYKNLDYNHYIKYIKKYIEDNNLTNYKIYLATDEYKILYKFQNEFGNLLIYNKKNIYLTTEKNKYYEPHFGFSTLDEKLKNNTDFLNIFHKNKPGSNGLKELIVDVLMLSKCNIFYNSISNLSKWVQIFNPNINVINLNQVNYL